jgi:hypothetical protein
MTPKITPEKRLEYLVEIARGYSQKGFVQDVLDTTAEARKLGADPVVLKRIEQRALWNGAYQNVLLWPTMYRNLKKKAEEYGFDRRLFAAGMLALAKDYESDFDRAILDELELQMTPIDRVLMRSQVVKPSDLEDVIKYEKKKAIHTTRAKSFLRFANEELARKEGWITATRGAAIVLNRYAENGALVPAFDKLVDAAISVNYGRKILAAVEDARKLAKTRGSDEDLCRHLVRVQTLGQRISHLNSTINIKKEIEILESFIQ